MGIITCVVHPMVDANCSAKNAPRAVVVNRHIEGGVVLPTAPVIEQQHCRCTFRYCWAQIIPSAICRPILSISLWLPLPFEGARLNAPAVGSVHGSVADNHCACPDPVALSPRVVCNSAADSTHSYLPCSMIETLTNRPRVDASVAAANVAVCQQEERQRAQAAAAEATAAQAAAEAATAKPPPRTPLSLHGVTVDH